MSAGPDALRRSEQIYRLCLKLYPRAYRREFEEEMLFVFCEALRDAAREDGEAGVLRLWGRIVLDTGKNAAVQQWDALKGELTMENKTTGFLTKYKWILLPALATALILLLPLIAMQYSDQVAWSLGDFVAAGALLFGSGLAFALITHQGGGRAYRAGVMMTIAAALLLVWVNLAVGVIGSEENAANALYLAVLAVVGGGAALARLRPQGMLRTLAAAALAQIAVTAVAFAAGSVPVHDGLHALGINGLFVALWVGAALLFGRASRAGVAA